MYAGIIRQAFNPECKTSFILQWKTTGKLQTVNVEGRHSTGNIQVMPEIQFRESSNFDVFNKRIGQLGKTCGKFDNGFYTVGGLFWLSSRIPC